MALQTNESGKELRGFMESIIQSNLHLIRTVILFAALACIIGFTINRSIKSLASNKSSVTIKTTDKGFSLQLENKEEPGNNATLYSFLLPSNDWWFDTGIKIEPGESCKIKISGRVHLALHKLVKSAELDIPSKVEWCGPNGNTWALLEENSKQDLAKRELLLYPGNKKVIGNVVGVFLEDGIPDFKNAFLSDRKSWTDKHIANIGAEYKYANSSSKTVKLYLAVNDILFDFSSPEKEALSKIAYLGVTPKKEYIDAWNNISAKGKEYYQLWYEDNIGNFLVQIEVRNNSVSKDNN